ncbi:autotransporter outer membrane beta-barrel domain-containing protein [Botrimarina mediterranea]|uniref:hypothetical protein n=1 Tax=Botrimarina mediterranea TaxID=2528022 RepID=UPI0011A27297|nr:hypothetical protein [Botrimarina mediterranea]
MLSSPIELGAALDDTGVGQFEMDPLFLGVEFDEDLRAGGIVGSSNAVLFPSIFGLPEVRADTRTGVRLDANITGRAGLELNASLDLGGLDADATFAYTPTLSVPDVIRRGGFFSLRGGAGLDTNGAFGVGQIDLPSASVGADVIFDVNATGRVDYGFAGVVPYSSLPFDWDVVEQPTDDDGNWTLLGVGVDLNNDTDFGTLTVAGQSIGVNPGDDDTVFGYDISLDGKQPSGEPTLFNRDIGRVEIVKPTLGDTLRIDTSLSGERGISHTIDADIFRLGVDIDGIASILASTAAGLPPASYTDFSKTIGQAVSDINGSIDGTLIDLKYGPELGYKYESSIQADFEVTLTFSADVAVIGDDGAVTITDTLAGDWSNLPEVALLDGNAVDVGIDFTRYKASRTDRGALTIGDYLEFQALAISANLNVGPFSVELAGLGPAIHARTSVLGALLGEFEIELFQSTGEQLVSIDITESGAFTMQAAPTEVLYFNGFAGSGYDDIDSWRVLGTTITPASLTGNLLVLGQNGADAGRVDQLTPATIVSEAKNQDQTVVADELRLIAGSQLTHNGIGSGLLRWELNRVTNDGTLVGNLGMQLAAGPTGVLTIGGTGHTAIYSNGANAIEANRLVIESGHTITLAGSSGGPALAVTQRIDNSGVLNLLGSSIQVTLTEALRNSGELLVSRYTGDVLASGDTMFNTSAGYVNDGLIRVAGNDGAAKLTLSGGQLSSPTGEGVFAAGPGGTLVIDLGFVAPGEEMLFRAEAGGTVKFDKLLAVPGVANLQIDDGGKIDIVNRGLLLIASGTNTVSNPGGGTIVPVNLDNNEGIVRIEADARFAISATIEDYAGGGATFDAGEWQIIGNPALFDTRNFFSAGGEDKASLGITITAVTAADNYLGEFEFDDEPGFDPAVPGSGYQFEDFDTTLAINASKVTLSGAAYFPYFNTVRENRGLINLREGIRFSTEGDLTNSGEINVENGAKLTVNGDLLLHGGSLRVEGRSGLESLDFALVEHDFSQHKIEVVGGDLVFGDEGFLQLLLVQVLQGLPDYSLAGDWTVRESVDVDAATGAETVRGALIDLGVVDRITRYSNGKLILDGTAVRFDAIQGLALLERGANRPTEMEVLGGFELNTENGLLDPLEPGGERLEAFVAFNETRLLVADGGKLRTEKLLLFGDATIGSQGYVAASIDTLVVSPVAGDGLRVDGVLDTPLLSVLANGEGFSGPGELSGAGTITGSVVVDGGVLTPGDDADGLLVGGDLTLSSTAATLIKLGGEEHGRLTVGSAMLGGQLQVLIGDDFIGADGETFELIGLIDDGVGILSGAFDTVLLPTLDFASFSLNATNQGILLELAATLDGDFNLDGRVDAADYTVWRDGLDILYDVSDYNVWASNFGAAIPPVGASVPEPSAVILTVLAISASLRRIRRDSKNLRRTQRRRFASDSNALKGWF